MRSQRREGAAKSAVRISDVVGEPEERLAQGPVALIARHRDECVFSSDALGLRPLWELETGADFVYNKGNFHAIGASCQICFVENSNPFSAVPLGEPLLYQTRNWLLRRISNQALKHAEAVIFPTRLAQRLMTADARTESSRSVDRPRTTSWPLRHPSALHTYAGRNQLSNARFCREAAAFVVCGVSGGSVLAGVGAVGRRTCVIAVCPSS